jgi:nucleotide-binding universal stress UspA family protein
MDVIVGFDGSSHSLAALRKAAIVAERTRKRLVVAEVWQYPSLSLPWSNFASPDDMDARTAEELSTAASQALSNPKRNIDVELLVLRGPAAAGLLGRLTRDSLLVLGTRGRGGFAGLLLGSVSRECVEYAPCPVLVVRGERTSGEGPIMVGLDGSASSRRALEWAVEYARATRERVVGAHAWAPTMSEVRPRMRERLVAAADTTARRLVKGVESSVEPIAVEGDPRAELLNLSDRIGAGLIVIGRRGAGGIRAMRMGSVATYLVSNSPTAVAVIPVDEADAAQDDELVTTIADRVPVQALP